MEFAKSSFIFLSEFRIIEVVGGETMYRMTLFMFKEKPIKIQIFAEDKEDVLDWLYVYRKVQGSVGFYDIVHKIEVYRKDK